MNRNRIVGGLNSLRSARQVVLASVAAFAIGGVLAAPSVVGAQTIWTGGTDDWNTPGNWSLGVPNAASGTAFDAAIENGGTAQLTAPPNGSVRRLRVGRLAGGGNLLVDAATLNVTENLHLNETSSAPAAVTVQNGATVSSPSTIVGYTSNTNTDFVITGAGTTFSAATQFVVGNLGSGTAALTIDNGGSLTSGTGLVANGASTPGVVVVRDPGSSWTTATTMTVGGSGTGTMTIENQGLVYVGTSLSINGTSTVNLNGGTLRFNTDVGSSLNRLVYNSGTIQLAGNRTLDSNLTVTYLFGPLLAPPASITIPTGKGLTVEGTAFQFQTNRSVTVNGGRLSSANYVFGTLTNAGGTLVVNNGGTVNTSVNVTMGDVSGSSGIATVSGSGSSWAIGGNATVGSSGIGTLTIQDQSLVYVGSALSINGSSNVNLQGGTLRFNTVSGVNRINFSSGTIQLAGPRAVGSDPAIQTLFGVAPLLPTGKGLSVEGIATLSKPVRIDGGKFQADGVVVGAGGAIEFDRGVLEIGFGGVTGLASLVIPANGEFRTGGVQTTRISGLAGSAITATSYLTLGDESKPNGFYTNGDLNVGPWAVLLADANDAVLDSGALVSLGADGTPGELLTYNGLTLDFGGNIIGLGAVTTPNSVATPFTNNGHISGSNSLQPITLSGYVKGVGTFDNVSFTGTFSPGLSPTALEVGNIALSNTSTLVMELGGTSPSSGYDQIHSSGQINFDGTLQLALINGFTPVVGQSFNLFDWLAVAGTFDVLQLPSIAGLTWNTSQLYSTGVISLAAAGLLGDYNQNGVVDAADYTVWRDHLVSGLPLPNDDSPGVGQDDYARWKQHFGESGGGGAFSGGDRTNQAVPEPASILLCVAIAIGQLALRQKKRGCPAAFATEHPRG